MMPVMNAGKKPPFFILGYARSGSTLFRHILNVHPNLAVIEEPTYWLTYYENISVFGDLKETRNLVELLKSISSKERFRSHGFNIDINQDLLDIISPRTYAKVIETLFALYAEKSGKKRWGVDNPSDLVKIPSILEMFPDARLIFLLRDIRSILASGIKITGDPNFNYYKAGLNWINKIETFNESVAGLPKKQWMTVKYEDLVTSPEYVLKKVCDFLDEPYTDRLVNYHKYAKDDIKHTKSDLYLKPISTDSINKWKHILNTKEVARLEAVCGKYMEDYNYKPITNYKLFNENLISRILYDAYHNLRAIADLIFFLKIRNKKMKRNKRLYYIRFILRYLENLDGRFVKKIKIDYLK